MAKKDVRYLLDLDLLQRLETLLSIFLFCASLQQRFPYLICFPCALLLLTQACQHGNSQHLEHLLFYGADSASQNASGNTALHICALYNKVPGDFTEDFC